MQSTFSGRDTEKFMALRLRHAQTLAAALHARRDCKRSLAGENQNTVLVTSFVFALSAPVESSAVTAKYQVPGVNVAVYVVLVAPLTLAFCV